MQQLDYWLYSGTKVTKTYGRIFKIQTYLNGQGRPRGELFVTNHGLYYYWMIPLYLKNRRANLPKVGAQDVQRSNRKQRESLCGWHVSEKQNKKVKHLTDLTVAIKAYPLNWFITTKDNPSLIEQEAPIWKLGTNVSSTQIAMLYTKNKWLTSKGSSWIHDVTWISRH